MLIRINCVLGLIIGLLSLVDIHNRGFSTESANILADIRSLLVSTIIIITSGLFLIVAGIDGIRDRQDKSGLG